MVVNNIYTNGDKTCSVQLLYYILFYFFIAESVSRMIADLPPKRVTRRLVFEAPNGNNQATINSVSIT